MHGRNHWTPLIKCGFYSNHVTTSYVNALCNFSFGVQPDFVRLMLFPPTLQLYCLLVVGGNAYIWTVYWINHDLPLSPWADLETGSKGSQWTKWLPCSLMCFPLWDCLTGSTTVLITFSKHLCQTVKFRNAISICSVSFHKLHCLFIAKGVHMQILLPVFWMSFLYKITLLERARSKPWLVKA